MDRYFDYAAAAPVSESALAVAIPFFTEQFHNPSSLYLAAHATRQSLENARAKIAEVLSVSAPEIYFTSGCTEANNLAIKGIMDQFPDAKMLYSAGEHESVVMPSRHYDSHAVALDNTGKIRLDELASAIDEKTVLVSVQYVNNELGTVQPLRKIAAIIESARKTRGSSGLPLYIHSDAAQAPNLFAMDCHSLGVDLMSASGAKVYGPKGIGCLYIKRGVNLSALIEGGGQERSMRSGTENVPLCVAFSEALKEASEMRSAESDRIFALTEQLRSELENIGGTILSKDRGSITSVLFDGIDNEYLVYSLDARGYQVSSGSACHASSGEPSRTLQAIGISADDAKSVIRISLGRRSTKEGVESLVAEISHLLANSKA